MKLTRKGTSVQLLVVVEKMMTQAIPIEKFNDIFGVEMNSIRPSTEPCGKLQLTVNGPLRLSSDIKVCVRPERYDWNLVNPAPATEKQFQLRMDTRQSWSTVSKGELRYNRPRSIARTVSL